MPPPNILFPDPALAAAIAEVEAAELRTGPIRPKTAFAWSISLSMLGALLWTGITYATGYSLGLVAVFVGILAGIGACKGGRGRTAQFIGAACAALGYFAGQFGVLIAFASSQKGALLSLEEIVMLLPLILLAVIKSTFTSIDAVFLGIAVYEGYRMPQER